MRDENTMGTFFDADVSVLDLADYFLTPCIDGRYFLSKPGILLTVDEEDLVEYLFDEDRPNAAGGAAG